MYRHLERKDNPSGCLGKLLKPVMQGWKLSPLEETPLQEGRTWPCSPLGPEPWGRQGTPKRHN